MKRYLQTVIVPAMNEDSMPSKRMVPEQEVAELSDEMGRLLALKDGVIAKLREQRDRAMGALREPSESEIDAAWMAYRKFKCQADSNREHIRAALVVAYAVVLAALDAKAAAETEGA